MEETDRVKGVSQVAGVPNANQTPSSAPTFYKTQTGTLVNTQFAEPGLTNTQIYNVKGEQIGNTPVINVQQLQNQQKSLNIPTYQSNLPSQIINETTSRADVMLGDQVKQAEERFNQAQSSKTAARGQVEELVRALGQKDVRAGQIAEETGLTEKENTYKQLNLEALAIRNSVNQQKEQAKAGTTLTQQEQINSAIDRQAAFQLTDLSIRQAVVGQDIARLETSLQNKLALEFEPIETELKIKQLVYEDLKDDFTKAEQRQFEAQQNQISNKIAQEKETRTAVNNILTTALQNGVEIPDSVVQQIVRAKDSTEAASILARNGISLSDPLDRAYKLAQIESLRAKGADVKPSTGVEKTALGFYNRAEAAIQDVSLVEDKITGLGLTGQTRLKFAPNFLQTAEGKLYNQAQRAFTEARLRKESGAAIPGSEFENDRLTYFAQPGDDQATANQKKAARQVVLNSLKFQSGNAYQEYYGYPPSFDEQQTTTSDVRQRAEQQGFDYQGAIDAGYTEEEINNFLK